MSYSARCSLGMVMAKSVLHIAMAAEKLKSQPMPNLTQIQPPTGAEIIAIK